MADIKGVGPDAPKVIRENGAGESHTPYRFDLLPSLALAEVARVMAEGAEKYGVDNWRLLPAESHLNHAMQHMFAYTAGDTQEGPRIEHMRHAATRILFCLECLEIKEIDTDDTQSFLDKMYHLRELQLQVKQLKRELRKVKNNAI